MSQRADESPAGALAPDAAPAPANTPETTARALTVIRLEGIHPLKRGLYASIGGIALVLGVLGVLLPLLPGTPFFLIAVWAFARSFPKVEQWLLRNRHIGPKLVAFRTHRVVPLSVKVTAWASMTVSFSLMVYKQLPLWVVLPMAMLMLGGAIYIARCPTTSPPALPRDLQNM